MRILLPIIQFPPDVNPTGVLMAQLGEGLAALGHEVSVITAFPHYENFRVWDEYRGKLMQWGSCGSMDVVRLYVYAPGKKSMVIVWRATFPNGCNDNACSIPDIGCPVVHGDAEGPVIGTL